VAVLAAAVGFLACDSPFGSEIRFADWWDFHFAWKAVLEGVSPYDVPWAEAEAIAAGVSVLPGAHYIYAPWFAIVGAPLGALDPALTPWFGFALSVGMFAVAVRALGVTTARGRLGLLLFPPVLFTLVVGQTNLTLLALLALAWSWRDRRPAWAGLALGVAIALKLSPALLLVLAALSRRRRMLASALATTAALFLIPELLLPGSTAAWWVDGLAPATAIGPRLAHPMNQGLYGFWARLVVPNPWTRAVLDAPGAVTLLVGGSAACAALLTWAVVGSRSPSAARERLAVAAVTIAIVALSPLAWESTWTLAVLPAALLWRDPHRRRWIVAAWVLFFAQRCLDGFSAVPSAFPWLSGAAPLVSLGLLGALCLYLGALIAPPPTRRT